MCEVIVRSIAHVGKIYGSGAAYFNSINHLTESGIFVALPGRLDHKVGEPPVEDGVEGVPLLYGVDAVHGHNNVVNATVFPHNIGLGAADDEELMERIGAVTAREVRATGIQWTFAPTLGNARNELWGRTYECYGEDADIVTRLGAAYVRGLQGEAGTDEFLDADHILATAKHYIGEGYTVGGQNQSNVVMDEEEFERSDCGGGRGSLCRDAGGQKFLQSDDHQR